MRKTISSILIFGLALNIGLFFASKPVTALDPVKYTDAIDYHPRDTIDITLEIPGGTDLYSRPFNVVLVLDRSPSMLDQMSPDDSTPRIDAAVEALKSFLDTAQTIGGANKPRVALATFGSDGYWERNFTTNYNQIRNKLDDIKDEIITNKGTGPDYPFHQWECSSTGDGLREAVDRLIDDNDANPDRIIIVSDGPENGQSDPTQINKLNHTSSFIEDNEAVADAINNNIKIYSVGVSPDVDSDLSQEYQSGQLGTKCARIYEPANYGYRTGVVHLRDKIAEPTGGTFTKITDSQDLFGLDEEIFNTIATDYKITVHERFHGNDGATNHVYLGALRPVSAVLGVWGSGMSQVEVLGNGCSGDGGEADKERLGDRQIWVKWDSIPQGETRCVIIHTKVLSNSPIDKNLPVDYGDALDWYYVEISDSLGEWTEKVEINQVEINVLSRPWLSTNLGNVGSIGDIVMDTSLVGQTNATELVITDGVIENFTSMKGWLVPDYSSYGGIVLHGPSLINPGDPDSGYDYYGWLHDKYQSKIKAWTNEEAGIAGRCPDHPTASKCLPTSGFWEYDSTFSINKPDVTDRGVGTEPTIFFIRRNFNLNDLSLHTTVDTWLRPMIFVVGGDVSTNVAHDERITDILRTFLGYTGPSIPATYYKGFFFVNGRFSVPNSQGMTSVHGSVVANEFSLRGDVGKADPSLNTRLQSEWFSYDPSILWYFRELLGDSQTSFKEVAP